MDPEQRDAGLRPGEECFGNNGGRRGSCDRLEETSARELRQWHVERIIEGRSIIRLFWVHPFGNHQRGEYAKLSRFEQRRIVLALLPL